MYVVAISEFVVLISAVGYTGTCRLGTCML